MLIKMGFGWVFSGKPLTFLKFHGLCKHSRKCGINKLKSTLQDERRLDMLKFYIISSFIVCFTEIEDQPNM